MSQHNWSILWTDEGFEARFEPMTFSLGATGRSPTQALPVPGVRLNYAVVSTTLYIATDLWIVVTYINFALYAIVLIMSQFL